MIVAVPPETGPVPNTVPPGVSRVTSVTPEPPETGTVIPVKVTGEALLLVRPNWRSGTFAVPGTTVELPGDPEPIEIWRTGGVGVAVAVLVEVKIGV